ncbi:MAG: hypothetical protein GJ680_03970 [Alteromonadaceae bacterium]|nr:hypothetical protein [Alteromonadaceae bacterium]
MKFSPLIFIVLCGMSYYSYAAAPVLVGYIERPPAIYQTADGRLRGSMGKRLVKLFSDARINVDYEQFKPSEIDDFMVNEMVDAFLATPILFDKSGDFVYTKKPFIQLSFYAYRLPSQTPVSSVPELSGSTIILPISPRGVRGNTKGTFLDPELNINVLRQNYTLTQALPLLRNGSADYYVSYIAPNEHAFNFSSVFQRSKLQADELFSVPMHIVMRESNPKSDEVIATLNKLLEKNIN